MSRWVWTCAVAILCLTIAGCNKQGNDQDAIRASIEKRLNGRSDLNMSVMDREVKQISVNGDKATAQVEFRLKGGDARMEIEYTLQRQGKEWEVLDGEPMGGGSSDPGSPNAPNAGGSQLPPGHPQSN
jgi:hypothetical protein